MNLQLELELELELELGLALLELELAFVESNFCFLDGFQNPYPSGSASNANIFSIVNQESKAEECSKKARDLLKIKQNKISDASHRESFINSLLLHQEIAAQHVLAKM